MDISTLNTKQLKMMSKGMQAESLQFTSKLTQIPLPAKYIGVKNAPVEAWRSNKYLVQVYDIGEMLRISVNRTEINIKAKRWLDGISWDYLMRIKHELGYGDHDAVEMYPRNYDVINVANIRHLWVLKEGVFNFGWRK